MPFDLGVTFIGIRCLHWIGVVSVPLFVVLGGWVAFHSGSTAGWDKVVAYAGVKPGMPMAFGIGLTIVLTLFVDAGTVTADFNRWAADTKGSLIATFCAFPFANLFAMLVGGIMTAALAFAAAVRPRQHVRLHAVAEQHATVGHRIYLFVYQSRLSLCSLPL